MVIRRSGQAIARVLWGVPLPVDPGSQQIDVEAPGYRAWSTTVLVGENGASASVRIPPLERAAEATPLAQTTPAEQPATATMPPEPPPPAADAGAGAAQRTLGFVVGGVGIVGMGVGGYFGLRAISKNDDAEEFCPGGGAECGDDRGIELTDDAKSAATIANIGVIGGAVLTGIGLFIVLSAPDDAPSTGLGLRTEVGKTRTSVSLTGAF
jgi:serine/threonine-protein kinase